MKETVSLEEHVSFERAIPHEIKLFVYERDRWACRSCNGVTDITPHHIIFRSEKRLHHVDNLVTVCFDCHRAIHEGTLKIRVINGNFFFGGRRK